MSTFMHMIALSICINVHSSYGLLAATPPRGWNSYDSYTWTINESQVLDNAKSVVQYLKPFGYEYIVIDYLWYQDINDPTKMYIDEYGRLLPDPNRYPHSWNENKTISTGFTWLAQQIHDMGLKFGIHTMRGISQTAVDTNTPVFGTNNQIKAQDIQQPNSQCHWEKAFSCVNMSAIGSQQFYDSLYHQYAEWQVDFIKNDCVSGGYYVPSQIIAVYTSIQNCERTMIYSVSDGNYAPPSQYAQFIHNITNMYRITSDDWDVFTDVQKHFNVTAEYGANQADLIGKNGAFDGLSWPDLDMLPFGYISRNGGNSGPYRMCSLTKAQQRIQMTLWCIARSPLFFGGQVMALANDSFTKDLLTNTMALSVNTNSTMNRQIYGRYDDKTNDPLNVIWAAQQNVNYYVAFFNMNSKTMYMNVSLIDVTMNNNTKACDYSSIWNDDNIGKTIHGIINVSVNVNDTVFLFLNNCILNTDKQFKL